MLKYVQDSGRTARIWGSLTQCSGKTPVRSKDVQMNLWNFGYANMDQMYEQGYDLINCNDGHYYIVPNAGYYYDYLNNENNLYNGYFLEEYSWNKFFKQILDKKRDLVDE